MPRWRDGFVYCVDGPRIVRVRPGSAAETYAQLPTPLVLGLCFLADGDLLAVAALDRKLYRVTKEREVVEFLDLGGIVSSPLNEILALPDGGWLIGAMGFDPAKGEGPEPTRLIHVRPDLSSSLTGPDLVFPNGMGWLSSRLVVAESFASRISLLAYGGNGQLGERRTLVDVATQGGHPDGLWPTSDGTVWYADAYLGTVTLVDQAGRSRQSHALPVKHAIACCLDDAERTLFVAAAEAMPAPGVAPAGRGCLLGLDLGGLSRPSDDIESI